MVNLRSSFSILGAMIALFGVVNSTGATPNDGEFILRVPGFAPGVGFAAHREALGNAQKKAIEQVVRHRIGAGDPRPFRSLLRKADRFVIRVEELRLDSQDGRTQVEADVYIDMGLLEQELATLALPRLPEVPTVSCLIAVESDGAIELGDPGEAELALVEGLKKLGLAPSPHTELPEGFKISRFHEAVLGDLRASAAHARETLADVALIGLVKLERSASTDEGAAARTRATLNLKVLRGLDGDLLEVFSRSAAITGVDPASCREEVLRDVTAKMVGDITVATVLSVLSMDKLHEVLITLHNPGSRSRLSEFTALLQHEPSIDSIEESFFSERLARIRLGYTGGLGYLVDLVRDRAYEGWPLEIQEVVGREMNLVFVPSE